METVDNIWISFKKQPDRWFFCAFLVAFTLSIRKILYFLPIGGQFNEYAAIYLYLSDILLIGCLASWFFILQHNKLYLSIYRKLKQPAFYLPLIFLLWALVSIGWSAEKSLAIFRSLKLTEFYLLYLYVALRIVPRSPRSKAMLHADSIQNVPRGTFCNYRASVEQGFCYWGGTFFRRMIEIVIIVGLLQAFFGIIQFFKQSSIGLLWLKESVVSPIIIGVAKVVFSGHKLIRAYGLFPHPNILGGFLVFSIILTLLYSRMFHPSQNVPRGTFDGAGVEQLNSGYINKCSTLNNCLETGFILRLILAVQILAIILSFSKSAILGLFLGCMYLYIIVPPQYKCSTWNIIRGRPGTIISSKNFKRTIKYSLLAAACLVLLIYIFKPSWQSFIGSSISDRLVYLNVSRGTILDHPVFGLGIGQYVPYLNSLKNLLDWQFQPVHNVLLLIWAELGLIGLGLFIIFLWQALKPTIVPPQKQTNCSTWNNLLLRGRRGTFDGAGPEQYFKAILIAFLAISLFDHYFWDIQQGQIMLWIVFGIIAGFKSLKTKTGEDLK